MKLSHVGLGVSLVGIVLSGIGDSDASGWSAAEGQGGEIAREGPPENPPTDDRDGVQPPKRPPERDRGKTDTQDTPDTEDSEETALAADERSRERLRRTAPTGSAAPRHVLPVR